MGGPDCAVQAHVGPRPGPGIPCLSACCFEDCEGTLVTRGRAMPWAFQSVSALAITDEEKLKLAALLRDLDQDLAEDEDGDVAAGLGPEHCPGSRTSSATALGARPGLGAGYNLDPEARRSLEDIDGQLQVGASPGRHGPRHCGHSQSGARPNVVFVRADRSWSPRICRGGWLGGRDRGRRRTTLPPGAGQARVARGGSVSRTSTAACTRSPRQRWR